MVVASECFSASPAPQPCLGFFQGSDTVLPATPLAFAHALTPPMYSNSPRAVRAPQPYPCLAQPLTRSPGGPMEALSRCFLRGPGAGLCSEPAEVMGIILTFFQRKRTNVGTGDQRRHGSLPFSLLFFLHIVFCFIINSCEFERGQEDLVGVTESLVLWVRPSAPPPRDRTKIERSSSLPVPRFLCIGGVSGSELSLGADSLFIGFHFVTQSLTLILDRLSDPGQGK